MKDPLADAIMDAVALLNQMDGKFFSMTPRQRSNYADRCVDMAKQLERLVALAKEID